MHKITEEEEVDIRIDSQPFGVGLSLEFNRVGIFPRSEFVLTFDALHQELKHLVESEGATSILIWRHEFQPPAENPGIYYGVQNITQVST